MKEIKRILFIGALWPGSTALQRMQALKELGYEVLALDTAPPQVSVNESRFIIRAINKLYRMGVHNLRARDFAKINPTIINCLEDHELDMLWIDKGMTIEEATLLRVRVQQPDCKIIGYSPDDMAARHNQSKQFLQSLGQYDVYFTTKSYGVEGLKKLGCNRVEFIGNAFDPSLHKQFTLSEVEQQNFGGKVGFIGAWEQERANSIYSIAKAEIRLRVWGQGWERCRLRHPKMVLEKKPLWASDYAKAICSFDINLCFLRKINRDKQTTRSIEIPACGAFMLAERTDEHLALFREGVEAEFFSSNDELLDKIKYYIDHADERKRIAAAGRERCLKSGYSNHDRLRQMLDLIGKA
jgi:spore maturation protein CgeB